MVATSRVWHVVALVRNRNRDHIDLVLSTDFSKDTHQIQVLHIAHDSDKVSGGTSEKCWNPIGICLATRFTTGVSDHFQNDDATDIFEMFGGSYEVSAPQQTALFRIEEDTPQRRTRRVCLENPGQLEEADDAGRIVVSTWTVCDRIEVSREEKSSSGWVLALKICDQVYPFAKGADHWRIARSISR